MYHTISAQSQEETDLSELQGRQLSPRSYLVTITQEQTLQHNVLLSKPALVTVPHILLEPRKLLRHSGWHRPQPRPVATNGAVHLKVHLRHCLKTMLRVVQDLGAAMGLWNKPELFHGLFATVCSHIPTGSFQMVGVFIHNPHGLPEQGHLLTTSTTFAVSTSHPIPRREFLPVCVLEPAPTGLQVNFYMF